MAEECSQEVETVFGLGRRKAHRDLVRAELGESLGHFRQAATHAADGVSATVGPRVRAARGYAGPAAARARKGWESTVVAAAPVAVAALNAARQTGPVTRKAKTMKAMQKKPARSSRGWTRLGAMLAAGTAVGAAGAFALRRRRQPRWDEYDPAQALDAVRTEAGAAPGGTEGASASPASPGTGSAKHAATTTADNAGDATPSPLGGTGSA